VAAFVSYLASRNSDYMTGQSVMIDGGSSSCRGPAAIWLDTGFARNYRVFTNQESERRLRDGSSWREGAE
jgi:hypothetical protein